MDSSEQLAEKEETLCFHNRIVGTNNVKDEVLKNVHSEGHFVQKRS